MLAYTYKEKGFFQLQEKTKPILQEKQDAIVKVDTCKYLCQRFAHKIREAYKGNTRYYGRT